MIFQNFFFYKLKEFLVQEDHYHMIYACREYWLVVAKPFTLIIINLDDNHDFLKRRHHIFRDTDIRGLIILDHKNRKQKKEIRQQFRKILEEYWFVEHPNIRYIIISIWDQTEDDFGDALYRMMCYFNNVWDHFDRVMQKNDMDPVSSCGHDQILRGMIAWKKKNLC